MEGHATSELSDTITHNGISWVMSIEADCEGKSENGVSLAKTLVGFFVLVDEVSFRLAEGLCLVKADGGFGPDPLDAPSFCIRHFLVFCEVDGVSLSKVIDCVDKDRLRAMGTGTRTDEFSECWIAEPRIKGGDMILGEGGSGEIDSGRGVTGKGEMRGVKMVRLGEGGMGLIGGEIAMVGEAVFLRMSRILAALVKVTCFLLL